MMESSEARHQWDSVSRGNTDLSTEQKDAVVTVLDVEHGHASTMIDLLRRDFPSMDFIAVSPSALERSWQDDADLRIVNLTALEPARLGELLGRGVASDQTTLFWADNPLAPQVCAARALGVVRIVPAANLCEWLAQAMTPLLFEGRGRRLLQAARDGMPPIPAWSGGAQAQRLGLAQAETMFRETYVAALLAEAGSCRRAAEMARVPYRTFYDMLKKLSLP